MFTGYIQDKSLSLQVQATCVRLLVSIIEVIFAYTRRPDIENASRLRLRQMLSKILDSLACRCSSLRRQVPQLLKDGREEREERQKLHKVGLGALGKGWRRREVWGSSSSGAAAPAWSGNWHRMVADQCLKIGLVAYVELVHNCKSACMADSRMDAVIDGCFRLPCYAAPQQQGN